ncbi:MAG: hypothetical protein ACRD6W_06055 [Nitrososphaerales archaeon]
MTYDPKQTLASDTLPPPADDTQQNFRLDLDPDDGDIMVLEDDGEID